MRATAGICIIFGVAIALSAVAAAGVGDLTYAKSVPPNVNIGGAGVIMKPPANPTALGLTHPQAIVATGARVAFDAETADAQTLTVARVDTTGAGNFANAKTVKLTMSARPLSYTCLLMPPVAGEITWRGKKVSAIFTGSCAINKGRVSGLIDVSIVGEGVCRFGKTERKVLVFDTNATGVLGDVAERTFGPHTQKRPDKCLVADAAGKFQERPYSALWFGQPAQVEGKWYTLRCKDMKITAAPLAEKTGELSVGAANWGCALIRVGDNVVLNVTGGAAPVSVPAGDYRIRAFRRFHPTHPKAFIHGSRADSTLTIAAGEVTSLNLGQALTATLTAKASPGVVSFKLRRSDATGARIEAIFGADGKRPEAPRIEVVDSAGDVIYFAELKYGEGGVCSHVWAVPRGVKGQFHLRMIYDPKPFIVTADPVMLTIK